MPHVDVELEGDRELVVHQPGGDEHALRIAQIEIAMANRIVAKRNVIAIGDHGVLALIHGQRYKIISFSLQSSGGGVGDGRDHPLQIRGSYRDFARDGVADAIGRLRDRRLPNNFLRRTRDWGCSLRHSKYSSALAERGTPDAAAGRSA